jgi:hypothetical protein
MPGQAHDTTSKPVISAIAAELFVADIKASCDFFSQKLGFSIVFTYGEPPFYAQVKRDRALLNLKCVDYPVIDPALRDRESLLSADMAVIREEIEQLFLEFQAAGIAFFQTHCGSREPPRRIKSTTSETCEANPIPSLPKIRRWEDHGKMRG